MGISPFKTYYQLLKEKVGIEEPEEVDNIFTEYGNTMEPVIRDYINIYYTTNYIEDKKINGDIRCHVDGWNETDNTILEIKTTSKTYKKVKSYKYYIVQLLFYMMQYNSEKGLLAVYERPKDFDEELNKDNLNTYVINIEDYQDWVEEIKQAIDKFRIDKKRLEENIFLGEEDFK